MQLKKLIENLSLVNEVNKLSLEELANKYLCNEESYSEFIEKYSEYFEYHTLYQLRVSPHYNKILDLVTNGHLMYPTETNENHEKKILSIINYNLENYKLKVKFDDEYQARFLLDDAIGNRIDKKHKPYEKLVDGMLNAAIKYDSKNDDNIEDLPYYLCLYHSLKNPREEKKILNKYFEDYPLAKECNDVYFLYLVNYLLAYKKAEVDKEFLDDVCDVINASKTIEKLGLNEHDDYKDYKKVAKYTMNNIKKYVKENNKSLKK